jgi:hypothetical protein
MPPLRGILCFGFGTDLILIACLLHLPCLGPLKVEKGEYVHFVHARNYTSAKYKGNQQRKGSISHKPFQNTKPLF